MIARLLFVGGALIMACATFAQKPIVQATVPDVRAEGAFWALVVSDLDASERWYAENMGLRRIKKSTAPDGTAEASVLEGQGICVELVHFLKDSNSAPPSAAKKGNRPNPGIFKSGVTVEPQVFDALLRGFGERKVQFVGQVFEDKDMSVRSFIVKDNSGNLIQFFAKLSGQRTQ